MSQFRCLRRMPRLLFHMFGTLVPLTTSITADLYHQKAARTSRACIVLQMKTSRTFLRECSVVSPLVLLLFGGSLTVQHAEGLTTVDGWLRVRAAAQTAVLVRQVGTSFSQKICAQLQGRSSVPLVYGALPGGMELFTQLVAQPCHVSNWHWASSVTLQGWICLGWTRLQLFPSSAHLLMSCCEAEY